MKCSFSMSLQIIKADKERSKFSLSSKFKRDAYSVHEEKGEDGDTIK